MDISDANKNFLKKDISISRRRNFEKLKPTTHYHNAYELFFLVKGKGNYFIKNKTYSMDLNSLFLIKEFDIHRAIINETDFLYDRYVIHFKGEYINKSLKHSDESINLLDIFARDIHRLLLSPTQSKQLVNLLEKVLTEAEQKSPANQLMVKAYLIQLLVMVYRIMERYDEKLVESSEKKNDRLQDVISFMNNNYSQNLRLKDIADRFFISKYYLSHFFKEKTGFTVIEYINNKRVMEAQKLLENTTEQSITEIAFEVGFNSLTHFERIFKKITGLTPLQFRNSRHY